MQTFLAQCFFARAVYVCVMRSIGTPPTGESAGTSGDEDAEHMWAAHLLRSIERMQVASGEATERLLPPGRVLWFVDGRRGDPAGEGDASAVAGVRPQQFCGGREGFSHLVFTRRMLTDHMPVSYVWALDSIIGVSASTGTATSSSLDTPS